MYEDVVVLILYNYTAKPADNISSRKANWNQNVLQKTFI